MPQVLEIGAKKQLFIDDFLIDETLGVCRNLNQPAKYVGNPIMIPLYPWEGRLELYGTVWRDPDGAFRMWYQGMGGMGIAHMGLDLRGTPFEFLNFDLQNLECSIWLCHLRGRHPLEAPQPGPHRVPRRQGQQHPHPRRLLRERHRGYPRPRPGPAL